MISWILWSPKRFGVVAVGLLLFLGFLALPSESSEPTTEDLTADESQKQYEEEILSRYREAENTFTPAPVPTLTPESTPLATSEAHNHDHDAGGSEPGQSSADPLALTVATTFVEKWLDTDDPNWPDVDDLALPVLIAGLETTDPANIPEGEVQDANAIFIGMTAHTVDVVIGEDTSVRVDLVLEPTQWYVRNIDAS